MAAAMCVLERNFVGLVLSATEDKIDRSGDTGTLFAKLRLFLENLPPELSGGYTPDHTAHMRVSLPETGGSITGEMAAGRGARGARASALILDESVWVIDGAAIDAAPSAVSPCRLDMSSVYGTANAFYQRAQPEHPAL